MKKDTRLNQKQIEILKDMFKRQLGKETLDEIAKSHNITRKTLHSWKSTLHGKQLYDEFMKELSVNDMPMFYKKLSEGVAKGEYKKMELFAKVHGLLAPEKKEVLKKVEEHDIKRDGVSKEMFEDLDALLRGESPTIRRVK